MVQSTSEWQVGRSGPPEDGDALAAMSFRWVGVLGLVFRVLAVGMCVAAAWALVARVGVTTVVAMAAGASAALAIGLALRSLQRSAASEMAEILTGPEEAGLEH